MLSCSSWLRRGWSSGLGPGLMLLGLAIWVAWWISPDYDPQAMANLEEVIFYDQGRGGQEADRAQLAPQVRYYVIFRIGDRAYHVDRHDLEGAIYYANRVHGGQISIALNYDQPPLFSGTVKELLQTIIDTLAVGIDEGREGAAEP